MRIVLDGMGGDNAPAEIVKGAAVASGQIAHEICIVGDEEQIKRELSLHEHDPNHISIVHAPDVVANDDKPVTAIRTKPDSSLVKALTLVKNGEGDLVLSAGNSGALMTGSLLLLGRIPGIDRPALGAPYPFAPKDAVGMLIDAGANSVCKSSNLMHFAVMGSLYAEKVFGIESPKVGLINMGAEPGKGGKVLREAYLLLEEMGTRGLIRFIGNVEARDIPYGDVDVLVGDGLTGNVTLKLTEGLGMALMGLLSEKFKSGFVSKIGAALLLPKLKELKKVFDYSIYGGAPVLGVRRPVVKIHGSSDYRSVLYAILKGVPFVENDVVGHIGARIAEMEEIGEILKNAPKQATEDDEA
ncbi:MAG: phosphate acyltransferase PlsX [Clostridiales bacterium]|nr:phosphate acyltransferase PlsX [Clostridiales bacterium]